MTGIERLCEFVAGISPITVVCGVTKTAYDREHMEEAGARLRDFLGDIADQIASDHAEDCFRMGERDAEDAEAVAWVKEHGGIAYVKDAWNVRSNLKRQLDKARAKVERQQRHIEAIQGKLRDRRERIEELNRELDELDDICGGESVKDTLEEALNLCAAVGCEPSSAVGEELVWALGECTGIVSKRLMPEGMEWPRFEDGELVRIGDEYECWCGNTHEVNSVTIREGCSMISATSAHSFVVSNGQVTAHGKRVKRPAPKVLDADGAEIELGDDLYSVEGGLKFHVSHIDRVSVKIATDAMFSLDKWADPTMYTHRAPVLAADGKPLREGETVWVVNDPHEELRIIGFCKDGDVRLANRANDILYRASDVLTHERPVADSWERLEEDARAAVCVYFGASVKECESCDHDPWECSYDKARDLVRRAKALAGQGAAYRAQGDGNGAATRRRTRGPRARGQASPEARERGEAVMAETLRPCPFCGGEAKLVSGTRRDGEYIENCAFVRCERCGAKTYELHECVTPYEVQKCATELWNERAERTCRVERVSTPYHAGPPRCSACMMPMEPLVNYCSYCGARVVSGDD